MLWKRLNHPNIASVLGVTMDPCQVVFDKVSNENVIQYTLNNVVDRGSLVGFIPIPLLVVPGLVDTPSIRFRI